MKPILLGFYKPNLHDIGHKDKKNMLYVIKFVYFLICSSKTQAMCIVMDMDTNLLICSSKP